MTDTGTDIEALAREVAEYLRSHRTARPVVNQAGQPIGPSLLATGRLIVNPGDEIQSVWGNTTYDQTAQIYASAADRDSQWSAPHDGSICYLIDSQSPWIRRSGVWVALPLGRLGSVTGPATQTDCGSTATTVISLAVGLTTGRRYRVSANALISQQTAAGNPIVILTDTGGYLGASTVRLVSFTGLPQSSAAPGSATWSFAATASTTVTFSLTGQSSAGVCRFGPNAAQILVEDIGT
jgi:hypothetical protein